MSGSGVRCAEPGRNSVCRALELVLPRCSGKISDTCVFSVRDHGPMVPRFDLRPRGAAGSRDVKGNEAEQHSSWEAECTGGAKRTVHYTSSDRDVQS